MGALEILFIIIIIIIHSRKHEHTPKLAQMTESPSQQGLDLMSFFPHSDCRFIQIQKKLIIHSK